MTLLRQIRERKGLSTYDVAQKLGVNQSHYQRVESEQASATSEFAAAIAKMFDVPVDLIFTASRYVVAASTPDEVPA